MFEIFGFKKELSKKEEIEKLLLKAREVCENLSHAELEKLDINRYVYSPTEAIEELGLDEELVHQLLEDYVIQILKSIHQFNIYIDIIRSSNNKSSALNYTNLRELAHKNLGVARNLRIKDAEKILYVLMKEDNLKYLEMCVKALESCAIKLKPECAYDTLKLLKVKSNL